MQKGGNIQHKRFEAHLYEVNDKIDELLATTEVNDNSEVVSTYILQQNYPNPFSVNSTFNNPGTEIVFEAPKAERVLIKVFHMLGNLIEPL